MPVSGVISVVTIKAADRNLGDDWYFSLKLDKTLRVFTSHKAEKIENEHEIQVRFSDLQYDYELHKRLKFGAMIRFKGTGKLMLQMTVTDYLPVNIDIDEIQEPK